MTYLPCVIHVMFIGLGIVSLVNMVSLKHSIPSSLVVVLETYTENPKNLVVYPFLASEVMKIIVLKLMYYGRSSYTVPSENMKMKE